MALLELLIKAVSYQLAANCGRRKLSYTRNRTGFRVLLDFIFRPSFTRSFSAILASVSAMRLLGLTYREL